MQVLLERASIIPDEEKAKIGDKLKMYDTLWEEHPRVKKIKAEAKAMVDEARASAKAEVKAARIEASAKAQAEAARIEAEAKAKAEIEAKAQAEAKAAREVMKTQLQRAMVYMVKARFPELTELAQQSARQIENPDILGFLLEKIDGAENEAEARGILRPSAA